MSMRLQILLDEAEYRALRRMARAERVTVAEWVRQALRSARRRQQTGDVERKLAAIRDATAIPIPPIGAAHPLKTEAHRLLERCVVECKRRVTDAEVLQEIFHDAR